MNTRSVKRLLCALAISLCLPLQELRASSVGAIPLEALLNSRESATSETLVRLVGVLGYTSNCGLAIYSEPVHAKTRDLHHGIRLADAPMKQLLPADAMNLDAFFGRYVIVSGYAERDQTAGWMLRRPALSYAFQEKDWIQMSRCSASDQVKWATVLDVLAKPSHFERQSVAISGVVGRYGEEGIALYVDESSAQARVHTHAIVLSDRNWIEAHFPESSTPSILGKYVVVSGAAIRGIARGSTPIVIKRIEAVEVVN